VSGGHSAAWRPGVTAATGTVVAIGAFTSASLGGAAAGGQPAVPGLGVRALADRDASVWVDNAGGNAGSHHAENRRLACAPIDVWGADLEHGSGTYAIVSEEPTDHDQKVVQGDWHYADEHGGKQVLTSLAGADLVRAAVDQNAAPHEEDGFHFAVRIRKGGVEHERHFWIAPCPPPAPAPPAPAAVPPRSGVSGATAAVPRTGADPRNLEGLLLVTAGSGCLGAASLMRRRRFAVAMPAGVTADAWPERRAAAGASAPPGPRLGAPGGRSIGARTAAVGAVLAIGLLGAVTTHLPQVAANGVGQVWATSVGLMRAAATDAHQLVFPPPPPARVVPVDVSPADSSESELVEQELSDLGYAFPADTHIALRRPTR
jgi:hypothetical protein